VSEPSELSELSDHDGEPALQGQDGVGIATSSNDCGRPHRMAYIRGEGKPTGTGADDGCPFCRIPALSTRRA
jgi:ATP adenylyltransferase